MTFDRFAGLCSVVSLLVGLGLLIATHALDDSWKDRAEIAMLVAAVFTTLFLTWWLSRKASAKVIDPGDLGPWRGALRNVMYQTWVGERDCRMWAGPDTRVRQQFPAGRS